MSDETTLAKPVGQMPVPVRGVPVQSGYRTGSPRHTPHLGLIIHGALRGRYRWVTVLSLLLAAVSAFLGYRLSHATYRSEGLVHIAYSLPAVHVETDLTQPMLMFDTYMQSQKLLITSRRMIDVAIQDPIWATTHLPVPPEPDRYFAKYLKVEISPRSEYIVISVTDTDPALAATAVTAVINSYADVYNRQENALESERLGILENEQRSNQGKIDDEAKQLDAMVKEHGTDDLHLFVEAAEQRVIKLQTAISDIRTAIAEAPPASKAAPGAASAPKEPQPNDVSIAQIAANDHVMLSYVREWEGAKDQLQQMQTRYGEAHPNVQHAQLAVTAAQGRVESYAQMYRQFHGITSQSLGDPRLSPVSTMGRSVENLRANEKSLTDLLEQTTADLKLYGNQQIELAKDKGQLASLRDDQTRLVNRIAVLRSEGQLGGRLSIISTGEAAISPERDFRLAISAGTGVAGLLLPGSLMVLWALIRRRYQHSDETEADVSLKNIRMLGILPEVRDNEADPEFLDAAAQSVHQLRVMLRSQNHSPSAYLITSATAGEGKTSLAMSLALSCNAARLKTLLIDGDFIARKITKALDLRDFEGLHEAISDEKVNRRITMMPEGLHVMPTGNSTSTDACGLSPLAVRGLFAEMKKHFEVIIVDTGPILGSLESAVFSREVDGIILTISRGQQRPIVDRGVSRIRSLGASITGCVFNRAEAHDFNSSPYGSSTRSLTDPTAIPKREIGATPGRFDRLGALVKAVAMSLPTLTN